jgi:protein regulator of cytokinesis 1
LAPGAAIPPSFDLSASYVNALDKEFTKVYEEYTRRTTLVQTICEEIIKLWAELGTPQAQTDSAIVQNYRDAPEQLGLHESDLASLKSKREKLIEEKKARERKIKDLKSSIESLWDRLGVEEADRKGFLSSNRGCGLRQINEFEEELSRLNELKRQNLHLFVEDARCRLQELWDGLYYSEEEMLDFTPAFSDVYSDALLSAHEQEIARLEALKEQRAPALQLIDKHRSLISDRESLAASSQDASRLVGRGNKGEKRDPTRLLREEKMRKRIAKELPKVEAELRKILEQWEDEYGRPFLVYGDRYLDEIAPPQTKALPPRSKTPAGPPPSTTRANSTKQTPGGGRPASALRGGAKTPTARGTMGRNNPSNNNGRPQQNGGAHPKSPTKIPGRVPLGNMPHGNNSPDRRAPQQSSQQRQQQYQQPQPQSFSSSMRGNMAPPRAPPPKMRQLVPGNRENTPKAGNGNYNMDMSRSESVMSGSISRQHVYSQSLEDVYDDRSQRPFTSHSHNRSNPNVSFQSTFHPSQSMIDYDYHPPHHRSYISHQSRPESRQQHQPYLAQPPRPLSQLASYGPPSSTVSSGSRQISNSSNPSTADTMTSGSENWETYDDASEPEADATDVYYAKVRAAQGKRLAAENGQYTNKNQCIRAVRGVEDMRQIKTVQECDDGWTDDMETY